MIDTKKYYSDNRKEENYFSYKYGQEIETYFIFGEKDFVYFDEDEIIKRFKVLTYPNNIEVNTLAGNDISVEFLLICFYLNKKGYIIQEFPGLLSRPENVSIFSQSIRNKLLTKSSSNTIRWADRRTYADNLKIEKANYDGVYIKENVDSIFIKVSTRNESFNNMSEDERLKEINNVIEYFLKGKRKFITLCYEDETFNYISEENVKDYRKKHSVLDMLLKKP